MSGGADVRVSTTLTVGLSGGYASDVSKLGQGLGRVEAKGWTAASYASFHPRRRVHRRRGWHRRPDVRHPSYSRRNLGRRPGQPRCDAALRALTAGYDGQTRRALWSVYLRAKSLDGKLKAYAENGSDIYSLAFDQRDLRSRIGVVGGRLGLSYKIGELVLTRGCGSNTTVSLPVSTRSGSATPTGWTAPCTNSPASAGRASGSTLNSALAQRWALDGRSISTSAERRLVG